MRTLMGILLLSMTSSTYAGVGLEEADYAELADIIVEATVNASDCLGAAEDKDTIRSSYEANLTIDAVVKGENVPDSLTLLSTVIEYKGEQPECGENGRIHPEGEVATFYLKSTDVEGQYQDVDQFSTFTLPESAPADNPICVDQNEHEHGDGDPSRGCSAGPMAPIGALWLPLLLTPLIRRR